MRKLLKKQGFTPANVVTDKLGSYSSALRELGIARRHDTGRWKNNRAENSPHFFCAEGIGSDVTTARWWMQHLSQHWERSTVREIYMAKLANNPRFREAPKREHGTVIVGAKPLFAH